MSAGKKLLYMAPKAHGESCGFQKPDYAAPAFLQKVLRHHFLSLPAAHLTEAVSAVFSDDHIKYFL